MTFADATINTACGYMAVTRFGVPADSSTALLHTSLDIPTEVRAGTRLRYSVVLSNPLTVAIPLDPCPVYTQTLVPEAPGGPQGPVLSFVLNCDNVKAVPAKGQIRFAMEYPTPGSTVAGRGVIFWTMAVARLEASATISVVDCSPTCAPPSSPSTPLPSAKKPPP